MCCSPQINQYVHRARRQAASHPSSASWHGTMRGTPPIMARAPRHTRRPRLSGNILYLDDRTRAFRSGGCRLRRERVGANERSNSFYGPCLVWAGPKIPSGRCPSQNSILISNVASRPNIPSRPCVCDTNVFLSICSRHTNAFNTVTNVY
jgi:hypothetical protein